MKTRIPLILILFLFGITISCEKDETEGYDGSQVLIKQIIAANHEIITAYNYNSDGQLLSSTTSSALYMNSKKMTASFEYENGHVVKQTGFIPGNIIMSSITGASDHNYSISFNYENNLLNQVLTENIYPQATTFNFKTNETYSYPDNQTVEVAINYIDPLINSISTITAYHFDAKMNITEIRSYKIQNNNRIIYYKEIYEYDDYPNPFKEHHNITLSSTNNVIKKSAYYYDSDSDTPNAPQVYTYQYQYSPKGFPTQRNTTNPNETSIVENFKYYNL